MDLKLHSDKCLIKTEGVILYYETPSLQTRKVFSGPLKNQHLTLPKDDGVDIEPDNQVLLKFRIGHRCFFGKAPVTDVQKETFTIEAPNKYKSLPRFYFNRQEISRPGRFNDEDACVKDLSVAGSAIEVLHADGLEVEGRYRLQLGRFSTFATINEISGNLIRTQFAIRDNLSRELNRIIRDSCRTEKKQRTRAVFG